MVSDPDEGSFETLTVLLMFDPLCKLFASDHDFDKFLKLDRLTVDNDATRFDTGLGLVTEGTVLTVAT
jgi:hypothetical protein